MCAVAASSAALATQAACVSGPGTLSPAKPRRTGLWVLGAGLASGVALVGYLLQPVCERLPDSYVSAPGQREALAERAARGEPFEERKGRWYQCKSRLARALFF